jgi:hypothetical protein
LYLFTGRAFPLLLHWSSDGDLTTFLLHIRHFNVVVQILPSASCARRRPALLIYRLRHPRCFGSIIDVLAATFAVHHCSTQHLPPALPHLLRCLYLLFITPAPVHIPPGRWHSNFVWHRESDRQTQPTVATVPFLAKLFLSFLPHSDWASLKQRLQWCLSSVYSTADTANRPRNAEPAYRRFLPASLAPPAFHGSTQSGSAGCLQRHILLLLSRHLPFHGSSQSLHITCQNHPTACGT